MNAIKRRFSSSGKKNRTSEDTLSTLVENLTLENGDAKRVNGHGVIDISHSINGDASSTSPTHHSMDPSMSHLPPNISLTTSTAPVQYLPSYYSASQPVPTSTTPQASVLHLYNNYNPHSASSRPRGYTVPALPSQPEEDCPSNQPPPVPPHHANNNGSQAYAHSIGRSHSTGSTASCCSSGPPPSASSSYPLPRFDPNLKSDHTTTSTSQIPGIENVRRRPKNRSVSNAAGSSNSSSFLLPGNVGYSTEEMMKRLSLPVDLKIPPHILRKSTLFSAEPMTRKDRRSSLSEIGFGKLESYTKLDKLGQGTYATVFKGRSRLTEALVALKEIRLEHEEGAPCTAIREVSLLRDLRHANIVTLHDIIHTDKSLTLVFEYLDRDLKQYMDECNGMMHMHNVQLFLYQLLRGLKYCHVRRILHRDLKPQNLLINNKGELKLADFGLARAKSIPIKTYSNEVVTLWYRPPDVLLGSTEYSTHIDMWGVGCIFYEMVSGRPFFPGSTVEEELHTIFKTLGTPTESTWPGISIHPEFRSYSFPPYPGDTLANLVLRLDNTGVSLLEGCLRYIGATRISAADALNHPHFAALFPPDLMAQLTDTTSIVDLPGVALVRDLGAKVRLSQHTTGNSHHPHHPNIHGTNGASQQHGNNQDNKRRQSMLF